VNRHPAPLTALVLTAAALTLSACGSDNRPGPDDKIAGAETVTEAPRSPSPSPERSRDRPEIELPSDLKLHFEDTETGDPVKQGFQQGQNDRQGLQDAGDQEQLAWSSSRPGAVVRA
jgi:hypothetical protein